MSKEESFELMIEEICALWKRAGVPPLNELPGVWHERVSEQFELWANAHEEPMEATPYLTLEPYEFYVERNGFPFAKFTGHGGEIGRNGQDAKDFIAALRKARVA